MKDQPREPCKQMILDVDGVLTDGRFSLDGRGQKTKVFDVHDGLAIVWFQKCGKVVAIVSGRKSAAAAAGTAELGIQHCSQGLADKGQTSEALKMERVIDDAAICVRDDLPDAPMMKRCGFPVG